MISSSMQTRIGARASRQAAAGLARSGSHILIGPLPNLPRLSCAVAAHQHQILSAKLFSTSSKNGLRDFFPAKDTPHIQKTKPAWPHHGYTVEEMLAVEPAHRVPRTLSDKAAWKIVRFARYWMDKATGMGRDQQVDPKHPTTAVKAEKPLTESQWVRLIRPIIPT